MGKRVLSWLLVVLMVFQTVSTPVYATGSNTEVEVSTVEETIVETESETETVISEETVSTEVVESSAEETVEESGEVEESSETVEETTVTETVSESTEELIVEETSIEEKATTEEATTELESTVVEAETVITTEEISMEEQTTEFGGENGIFATEDSIAEIKNITVESVGYQEAKIVFEVDCTEGASVSYSASYECSDEALSDTSISISTYKDSEGKRVDGKYYIMVDVQPDVTLSYTISVKVTDSSGILQSITANESVSIKGMSLDLMNPTVMAIPNVEQVYFSISIDNYSWRTDELPDVELYKRVLGETEWVNCNNSSSSTSDEGIQLLVRNFESDTKYECYLEFIDRNGTGATVQTDVIIFSTEKDITYTREDFPDEGFYEVITDLIRSGEITQSALDEIVNVAVSTDENDIYGNSVAIKNIEGIQYCRNVEYINLGGQEIEDASPIEKLTKLKEIDLNSNNLKSIPDMSRMDKLKSISLNHNMIPRTEFTDDKLSEYFLSEGFYTNWKNSVSYQRTGAEEIITVPVNYGWGEAYPVVFGLKNSKRNIYKIALTIGEETYEKTMQYWGTKSGVAEATVIPNTQLSPGEYADAKIEVYDPWGKKVTEKIFDLNIAADESTYYLNDLALESGEYLSLTGELVNADQNITKIEIVKDSVVYAQTTREPFSYIYGDSDWDYNERYYEILGDYVTVGDYETERMWVEYSAFSILIEKDLEPGNYDIRFTLADNSVRILEDEFVIDDVPKVFSVEPISYRETMDTYRYNNAGEYFYISLYGYNLDESKIFPEFYVGDELVTEDVGVVETSEHLESALTEYIYKLRKVDIETYWKGSCSLRWKLHVDNGYQVEDVAEEHLLSYWYDSFDVGLIWVDDYVKKDSMQIYFNSIVEDGTKVTLEVYESYYNSDDDNGYKFSGAGEGNINNQSLSIDLYDEEGNLCYLDRGTNKYRFIYNVTFKDGSTSVIERDSVSTYSEGGVFSTKPVDGKARSGLVWLYVPKADYKTTFKGFQLGEKTIAPVEVDLYLPGNQEKVKTIQANINSNNVYLFTKSDVESLIEGQPYEICVRDKGGDREIISMYGYLVAGNTTSTVVNPTKITLNKTSLVLGKDETTTLKATVSPTNATNKSVTWSSNDTSIATVDGSGNVTAVAMGTAYITARTHNGLSATCKVTVYNSEGEDITVKPGEEYTITIPDFVNAKNAKFTSADTTVATVTNTGVVSGVGLGITKITLQSGSIKVYYAVTVTNPLQSIHFEEEAITMEVGKTMTNSIVYTLALTDSSKAITVNVDDSTIATATVVGRTIRINALAAGTATVTATVGELQAACEVTVISTVTVPDLAENIVYAFLNREKTLGELDSQLPAGFDFVEPNIQLSKFAGVSEKEFAVIYTDENGRTEESVQTVKFVSVSGISMVLDKNALEVSEEDFAQVQLSVEWSGYDTPSDIKDTFLQDYEYEVSANKEGIVAIEGTGSNYTIKGLKKGKVTLTAVLRKKGTTDKNGILFKATTNVNVTEEAAKIRIGVEGAAYNEEKDYYVVDDVANAAVVLEAIAEGYNVKWSASDSSIVKIGATKENKTPITVKANGKVKLTATANDSVKTSKSIMLYIIDTKPSIDGQVTINKALANGGTMGIYASYGYEIAQYDVQIMKEDNPNESDPRFQIDYNEAKDIYEVCLADADNTSEGKYNVNIKVTAATETGDVTYSEKVVITVVNKKVTYSTKQSKKVNLFYSDEQGNGILSVNGKNAVIESVDLEDCDFSYDYETGAISFIGDDYDNPDKEGTLVITFEGYAPVSKTIKINTEVKKPKLKTSASSSVLYPNAGIKTAKIQLTDSATGVALYVENANMNQENLERDAYKAYTQDGEVYYALKDSVTAYPKSAKITFNLQMDNWNDEIAVSHTIKSNSATNPAVTLSNKTITLNKNDLLAKFQAEEVTVKVKNATENSVDGLLVSGADKKSVSAMNKGMDFAFDEETGKLSVWFNDSKDVKAGTYTYNLSADVADGETAKTKLKIKVVDKTPVSTVTVKTKGSIDIIDRENTSVICTPKFTNISGKVVDVKLAGENAHLFNVSLNESGLAEITAREDAAYITKYAYKLQLVYTLESSDRDYDVTSKAFSLKVKQGKPTVTAKLDSTQLYQAADNAINVDLTAMNKKGTELEIREVAIVEAKATKGVFKLVYDENAECYKLSVSDVSKLKKNKNYTVKMNVWMKDQADNEKSITVSVKVKVK